MADSRRESSGADGSGEERVVGRMTASDPVVLVVDDDPELADLYARWLARTYTTQTAYDGETALDVLDSATDAVFLDRRMPGLSGDAVAGRIDASDVDCHVVLMSAITPDFDLLDLPFDDYLRKPVSGEDLASTLETVMARSAGDPRTAELCTLERTRTLIGETKSEAALAAHDGFQRLLGRIETLRADTGHQVQSVTSADSPTVAPGPGSPARDLIHD